MNSLVKGNTAFALQLYSKLQSTPGNLIFSPYSISSALAMTCAGARGATARQMEQVLHLDQVGTNFSAQFGQLDADLKQAQGSNELSVANSLWPQEKYPVRTEFLKLLKQDFGATVTPANYTSQAPQARAAINRWVDEKTRHKIPEIIGPGTLNALTRMVLVNAIYFKGTWQSPFPESATRPDKFYLDPGTTITVPFMHRRGHFQYAESPQWQLLALPYAGGQLEMILLLPRSRDGIAQLESNLSQVHLKDWLAEAKDQNVAVALPKFKMATSLKLSDILRGLGMTDAFSPDRADFSGVDGKTHFLYLSAVLHKAYVEVNEKGTEAAAATAVTMKALAVRLDERPRKFRADHPFLFCIRDASTGSLLFMGRVSNPANH